MTRGECYPDRTFVCEIAGDLGVQEHSPPVIILSADLKSGHNLVRTWFDRATSIPAVSDIPHESWKHFPSTYVGSSLMESAIRLRCRLVVCRNPLHSKHKQILPSTRACPLRPGDNPDETSSNLRARALSSMRRLCVDETGLSGATHLEEHKTS